MSLAGSLKEHPIHNEITDNHIHHVGVYHKYSAGVFLGLSEGNVVGHNLIEHVPHHAVNLGSHGLGRNLVEYNKIRHAAQQTCDTAAINCWMEQPPRDERSGHVIRYNFIADTGLIITRPPIGTNTTGQEAEGPNCLSEGGGH